MAAARLFKNVFFENKICIIWPINQLSDLFDVFFFQEGDEVLHIFVLADVFITENLSFANKCDEQQELQSKKKSACHRHLADGFEV